MSAISINFYFFHQMITLQKLWTMLFISSKKLVSISRYSFFVFMSSPLFLRVDHCFRVWSKTNPKVHDVFNCLNKNSITQFVWYLGKEKRYNNETLSIDGVSNKNTFIEKSYRKCAAKASRIPLYNFGK